jgi:hypothetical protein
MNHAQTLKAIINFWAADDEATHPKLYANEWEDFLTVSRPGVFQDPDALLVGNVMDQHSCRACAGRTDKSQMCPARDEESGHLNYAIPCMCCGSLSPTEEQTNMVMWAMFAAPLEIAADLRSISNASAAILKNREVIAVNQDPLVIQARRVSNVTGLQVWSKRLVDDSVAVALYNSNDEAHPVPVIFEQVGFTSCDQVLVRDLVRQKDLGVFTGGITLDDFIPAHGSALLNLSIVW